MATFTNQATLTYNGISTLSNVVTGEIQEELAILKYAVSRTYNDDNPITYIISIVNSGTNDYTNITLTDNLGEYTAGTATVVPLTYQTDTVNQYINGVLSAIPTVTSTNPLTMTGINVPAGGNTIVAYSATPNEYAPLSTTGEITNTATISGGGLAAPLSSFDSLTPVQEPELSIIKSANPTVVPENGTITYTFTISNTGNTEASTDDNVVVSDLFNPILDISSVTLNGTALPLTTGYLYNETTGQFSTVAGQIVVPAATFTQDPTTGVITTTPGQATLIVTGTI